MYPEIPEIKKLVEESQRIVIIQADNPDGDSLGSALALEQILGDLGKETFLYCSVDMPGYLRFMQGWDRVSRDLEKNFDLSIIVDASTMTLFENLEIGVERNWLASKPCIVLDHHEIVERPIPFATVTIKDHVRASAGELIYLISKEMEWPISVSSQEFIMSSILGDTQGLSNQLTTSQTYRVMAELTDNGVFRPKLEELRREYTKMPEVIFKYKAKLIERTNIVDGELAMVSVPQSEINSFSPLYNPGPLIQADMLQTQGVKVAIVLKQYDDGRITAAIRCNAGSGIAADLAKHFGGGGHQFASGFKLTDGRDLISLKEEIKKVAKELLTDL